MRIKSLIYQMLWNMHSCACIDMTFLEEESVFESNFSESSYVIDLYRCLKSYDSELGSKGAF